jgi:phage gpG-like protein
MITITVNADATVRKLNAVVQRLGNLAPAMAKIATRLHQDVLRNFREGGWFPAVWPASGRRISAQVKANRRGRPAAESRSPKTLMKTGNLRNSFHATSGADSAEVGTGVVYAAAHQFGHTYPPRELVPRLKKALSWTGPDGLRVARRRVHLPAIVLPPRPMLPVDAAGNLAPETKVYVQNTIRGHVVGGASA